VFLTLLLTLERLLLGLSKSVRREHIVVGAQKKAIIALLDH
jgi:hypothetical protein